MFCFSNELLLITRPAEYFQQIDEHIYHHIMIVEDADFYNRYSFRYQSPRALQLWSTMKKRI